MYTNLLNCQLLPVIPFATTPFSVFFQTKKYIIIKILCLIRFSRPISCVNYPFVVQVVTMIKFKKNLNLFYQLGPFTIKLINFTLTPNVVAIETMMGHMYPERKFKIHKKKFFFEKNRTKFLSKILQDINVYISSIMSVNFSNVICGIP